MEYRRIKVTLLVGFVILLGCIGAYFLSNFATLNFHAVVEHHIYRSRQVEFAELRYLQQEYHFQSIINLRGAYPKASWYQGEVRVARQQHVHHYTFALPAHGLPSWEALSRLVSTLQQAPQPVLLHCREGADRTGLAAAIVLMLAGASEVKVKSQVSWQYGVVSPRTIGYQVLRNYFRWIKQEKLPYGTVSFLAWVHARPPLTSEFGWYLS